MRNTLVKSEPVTCVELVEVQVTANSLTKIPIQDIPMLKSYDNHKVIIKSIELITPKNLSHGPLSGQVAATRAETLKCSLVLYAEGWEKVHFIPLFRLNAQRDMDATTATTIPFADSPLNFDSLGPVDWTKSYIQYSNSLSSANSPYCFILMVNYVILDNSGNPTKP